MLVGLGSTTATVAPGRGGSTVVTSNGRTTIVLPDIEISGRVPATASPKPASPAKSPFDISKILEGKIFGVPKAAVLGVGLLGLLGWGLSQLGGGRRRYARNPRRKKRRSARALYVRNPGRPPRVDVDRDHPDVRRAVDFRREFHWGYPAKSIRTRRRIYDDPKVLVMLGKVKAITYQTSKKGERARYFVHDFEGKRPELGMDIKNRRLHFVGGSYTVTADGITG